MNNELGDFQTPMGLVEDILQCLAQHGILWTRVLEPTCGQGNFILGLLRSDAPPDEVQAIELQDDYAKTARRAATQATGTRVIVRQANLFDIDLGRDLEWRTDGPLLVIGNPPWVTNSALGAWDSQNHPHKSNFKRVRGIEALTGSANFDLTEYIWLKLMRELGPQCPTIALLCKTSVARNVLLYASQAQIPVQRAWIRRIDAGRWFEAAVDACLFCVEIGKAAGQYECPVYSNLWSKEPITSIGAVGGRLIADLQAYRDIQFMDGTSRLVWRQGIKHDAASVMELTRTDGQWYNKMGECVDIEAEYVFPLLKSTDLFHGPASRTQRAVIVTQTRLGDNTLELQRLAPRLWHYLSRHASIFEQRRSSIYRHHPPFAMFGIGDYSFAPYKVAISGLHKTPKFRALGQLDEQPIMLDDTCYFMPCQSASQAAFLTSLLNHSLTLKFIDALAFPDAKRPITKRLLQRMDLYALLSRVDQAVVEARARELMAEIAGAAWDQAGMGPSALEDYWSDEPMPASKMVQARLL